MPATCFGCIILMGKETVQFWISHHFYNSQHNPTIYWQNNNDSRGVTYEKFGCYQINDAIADDVINQLSPKHCSHYQQRGLSTSSFYACYTLVSHSCNKVWKEGPNDVLPYIWENFSNSPSISGGLGRCPRRRSIYVYHFSQGEKRLLSVSKTDQHLRFLHLMWTDLTAPDDDIAIGSGVGPIHRNQTSANSWLRNVTAKPIIMALENQLLATRQQPDNASDVINFGMFTRARTEPINLLVFYIGNIKLKREHSLLIKLDN